MGNLLRKALIVSLSTGVLVSELGCDAEPDAPGDVQEGGVLPLASASGKADGLGTMQLFWREAETALVVTDTLVEADQVEPLRGNLWVYDPGREIPEHLADQITDPPPDSIVLSVAIPLLSYARERVTFGIHPEDDTHMRMTLFDGDSAPVLWGDGWHGIDCLSMDANGLHMRSVQADGTTREGTLTRAQLQGIGAVRIVPFVVETQDESDPAGDGMREHFFDIALGCDDPYPAAPPPAGEQPAAD